MPSDSDLSSSPFHREVLSDPAADTALALVELSHDDRALLRKIYVVLSEVCVLTRPGAAIPAQQIVALRRMLHRADLADLFAPDTNPPAGVSMCGLLPLLCDSRLAAIAVRLQVADLDLMDADDLPALYEVASDYLATLTARVPGLALVQAG
ncbi:MAG TPA: hypothetical protein VFS21_35360 [Roseiflexaceae bacterium]|nr:hypothetical protein [Roseiflexaceae bacterium]